MPLSVSSLELWSASIAADLNTQLGASVLANFNAEEAFINQKIVIKNTAPVFNTKIVSEGAPVTNQKSSGRCWLFAAGNVLRVPLMAKLGLKEFQFSQSYWFFYDKLEKCNFFLEQFAANIDSTPSEDLDSRLNLYLLTDPTCDGGQFDMFINIVQKYGMVPYGLYPDTYSSAASRTLNFMLKTKLRMFAQVLRKAKTQAPASVAGLLEEMQQEIHRLMVMFLSQPPHPDQHLTWEYNDKDDQVHALDFTPLLMYKEVVGVDLSLWVSLLNDPRNPYERVVKIDKLGNMVGGRQVSYLNIDIDALASYAVKRIQGNNAVFFGTHTPIYMDKKRGIMDESLFNYELIGFKAPQSKASRIQYHQSLMTHAMALTAVHLNDAGEPVRWRVENSWGKDSGQDGYYVMDHQYFRDYVYQIVTESKELEEKHQEALHSEPVVLPPWDPMGALATFQNRPDL